MTSDTLLDHLLDRIKSYRDCRHQWLRMGHLERALFYETKLVGVVELLEVYDCRSVGGFGKGQPKGQDLMQRVRWLLKKYEERV
jgi:hypothetical protein